MKAIIYARFSPRKNAEECESIETQIERCQAYCSANGLEIDAIYTDQGLSGAKAYNRPGLQQALDHVCLRKGNYVLIVYSLSRLARNTRDAIDIADRIGKAGADMASIQEKIDTTSAMGRFVFRLMSALAELEREQISERTSDAMLRHQESGRAMSYREPYGYMRDPDDPALLIEHPQEQDNIQRILDLRANGESLNGICHQLIKEGRKPRNEKWHHTTIKKILQREGKLN